MGEQDTATCGFGHKETVEQRLRQLEGGINTPHKNKDNNNKRKRKKMKKMKKMKNDDNVTSTKKRTTIIKLKKIKKNYSP